MRLINLLRKSRHQRQLAVEAAAELLRAWALVRFRAFPRYSASLGAPTPGEVPVDEAVTPSDKAMMRDIRWAIDALDRSVWGRFTCLMKAMAVQRMLARRGVASGLVLGARMLRESTTSDTDLAAHAWLWAGGVILMGGEARAGFLPLTTYLAGNVAVDSKYGHADQ